MELAALHLGYEQIRPYPLRISGEPSAAVNGDALYDYYHVDKMRFGGKGTAKDKSTAGTRPGTPGSDASWRRRGPAQAVLAGLAGPGARACFISSIRRLFYYLTL
jgi:hypothetical protein